ncbi:MAG TPA: aspartyl protease family protein [Gemmataceae bacterium]|nr:aspartyl protease family protein [Gemmataceae bacterium]
MRFWIAIALMSAAALPSRADEAKCAPVTVPFEMLQAGKLISGHLAVQVKVNGKGPYRLVFDTGAPMILLSTRVGKEAGLTASKRPAKSGTFAFPGQVQVPKLQIGDLVAEDMNAIMLDHPTVKAIAEVFGPIDGIVGFPFFARYRTTIDYQTKTLTFVPSGYQPGDVMQMMMATLLQPRKKGSAPLIVGAAAQWGLRVEKADDDDEAGVIVAQVFSGGAAAKAGIRAGDRLLTLDGRWTDTVADCYQAAKEIQAGQHVNVLLRRNGKEIRLTVAPAPGF